MSDTLDQYRTFNTYSGLPFDRVEFCDNLERVILLPTRIIMIDVKTRDVFAATQVGEHNFVKLGKLWNISEGPVNFLRPGQPETWVQRARQQMQDAGRLN